MGQDEVLEMLRNREGFEASAQELIEESDRSRSSVHHALKKLCRWGRVEKVSLADYNSGVSAVYRVTEDYRGYTDVEADEVDGGGR